MNVHEILVAEFTKLALDELQDAEIETTPSALHQVLADWCDVYEDVTPRNRAERTVRDALIDARDDIQKRIRESLPKSA